MFSESIEIIQFPAVMTGLSYGILRTFQPYKDPGLETKRLSMLQRPRYHWKKLAKISFTKDYKIFSAATFALIVPTLYCYLIWITCFCNACIDSIEMVLNEVNTLILKNLLCVVSFKDHLVRLAVCVGILSERPLQHHRPNEQDHYLPNTNDISNQRR